MMSRQALKCAECGRTLPNDAVGDRMRRAAPSYFETVRQALRAAIGTHGDACQGGANCQAMAEFSAGFAAVDLLEVEIAAKDDLIAEARLALRRLHDVTPDYRSTVAAREYAVGVLATLDAPDTGTQDDQVAAPVVDAIREHLKEGESHDDFIARTIREAKR